MTITPGCCVPQGKAHVSRWSCGRFPPAGLGKILQNEPAGLCIGKVELDDGREVLGVLAEPWLVEGQKEITQLGGWRAYTGQLLDE
ncbi:glutamyl-tRNA(Gln) amidotransferase subunit A [Atlantibacter hermannii]|nr:glutamyl-tRNA(Gln) amidotransferase subunit A [Atlantibacter hermannii]